MRFPVLKIVNEFESSSNLMVSTRFSETSSFFCQHLFVARLFSRFERLHIFRTKLSVTDSGGDEMYIPTSRVGDRKLRPKDIKLLRAGNTLRDELMDIIFRGEIRARASPDALLLRSITVSEVVPSSDLSFARVYVAMPGNAVERRKVFVWLCENIGQIRFSLSRRLRHWRRVPKITFRLIDPNCISDVLSGETTFSDSASE
jgi:ribosome-binding factor A